MINGLNITTAIHGREKITDLFLLYHYSMLKRISKNNNINCYFNIAVSDDDPQMNEGSVLNGIILESYKRSSTSIVNVQRNIVRNNPIGNKWNESLKMSLINSNSRAPIMILGSDDFLDPLFIYSEGINKRHFFNDSIAYLEQLVSTDLNKSCFIINKNKEENKNNIYFGSGRIISGHGLMKLFLMNGHAIDPTIEIGLDRNFEENFKKVNFKKVNNVNYFKEIIPDTCLFSLKTDKCINSIDKILKVYPDFEAPNATIIKELSEKLPFLIEIDHEKAKEQARTYFD